MTAKDANNDRLTYALEAAGTAKDADVFQIDRMTGQVTVGLGKTVNPNSDAMNEEDTETRDGDTFTVTIKATDPSGQSDTVVMTITVDEVDEAPVFTAGKMSHMFDEIPDGANSPDLAVDTFTANDPEEGNVTYSLSGDDAGKLSIDSSGALTFDASPDFEARGSADGDNVYEVTVKAASTDGAEGATEKSTTVDVTVTVTNVDEPGMVSLSASQPRIGVEIRADMPTDLDGGVTGVTWQWSIADTAAFGDNDNVTKIKDATNAGYTPVAADDGKYLRVTATYTDAQGSGKTAVGEPAEAVVKVRNLAPAFTDEDTSDDAPGLQINPRKVAEDADDGDKVNVTLDDGSDTPVAATDTADADDNESILYLLGGADAASFAINSGTGQISVGANAMLDHETKDTYVVTVTARDPGGLSSSVDVTIEVTDVNEAPVITVGGLAISGQTNVDYAENGTDAVATYTASGPDAATATWSLSGDDADDFDISSGGELTFAAPPDYEAPTDADANNVYMVTVEATDGTNDDTQTVTVTVTGTDMNEAPEFASAMTTRSVEENTAAGENIGHPVKAMDDDGDTLTYRLGGDDLDSFDIATSTGQLMTKAELDFETDDSYTVTVTASDGTAGATIMVTIMVTDVNEAPEFASAMTTISVVENTAAGENIGEPIEATDVDGDTLTYTLGGDDAASFDIAMSTGQLMTKAELDFETDDSYTVTVTASDGTAEATITVTIMVTNMDEDGMVTLTAEAKVGVEITAMLDDPDGGVTGLTWQWASAGDDGQYTDITGATSTTYTPVADDEGEQLLATATYDDAEGSGKTAAEMTAAMVVPAFSAMDYDGNGNDAIELDEVGQAILDFFKEGSTLTEEQVGQVILLYFRDAS